MIQKCSITRDFFSQVKCKWIFAVVKLLFSAVILTPTVDTRTHSQQHELTDTGRLYLSTLAYLNTCWRVEVPGTPSRNEETAATTASCQDLCACVLYSGTWELGNSGNLALRPRPRPKPNQNQEKSRGYQKLVPGPKFACFAEIFKAGPGTRKKLTELSGKVPFRHLIFLAHVQESEWMRDRGRKKTQYKWCIKIYSRGRATILTVFRFSFLLSVLLGIQEMPEIGLLNGKWTVKL